MNGKIRFAAVRSACLASTAAILAALSNVALACPFDATAELEVRGAALCVFADDSLWSKQQQVLRTWIERSARIVADYYGQFPAPLLILRLQGMDGSGVGGGRTTNDAGLMIQLRVGKGASAESLAADWVLVHEMVHLALPEVGRAHNWLAEGLATYVEGVARAQYGNREIADVWAEDRSSMPKGLPRAGEGGMDQTPTWGRTYWGGALYCLQADVAIREQTANRVGLQTALRAILKNTGGYGFDRDIGDVLRIGDAATGTHVLYDLYQKTRAAPLAPDLESLWTLLGVPNDPMTQPFDDHARFAAIRIAITARLP